MITLVAGGLAATMAGAVVLLRRRFRTVVVVGPSMEPTLHSGDRVLVRRVEPHRVRRGQVVVVRAPTLPGHSPWLIKRAVAVPGDPAPHQPQGATRVPPGSLFLLGDNPARSYDSRQAGYFDATTMLGIVIRTRSLTRPGGR